MRFCFYINREIRLTLWLNTTDALLAKIYCRCADVHMHVCMFIVPCCAAQDKVQFKLQLSGSL